MKKLRFTEDQKTELDEADKPVVRTKALALSHMARANLTAAAFRAERKGAAPHLLLLQVEHTDVNRRIPRRLHGSAPLLGRVRNHSAEARQML